MDRERELETRLKDLYRQRNALSMEIDQVRLKLARLRCPFRENDIVQRKGERVQWIVLEVADSPVHAWKLRVTSYSKTGNTGKGEIPLYPDMEIRRVGRATPRTNP